MNKILLIGSGSLKIGEAGEFDYSGTQAIKAIREEGLETILINPNIATIQTSEGVADKIYFVPITQEFVEKIIEKEKPQGILVGFGGQTALNCGIQLFERGILKQHDIKVLGTNIEDIIFSEDRDRFISKLNFLCIKTAHNKTISSRKEAIEGVKEIGFPLIIRVAYALGGLGSGFAASLSSLVLLVDKALVHASQILMEESLKGWKEIEYEVVRDRYGNCITVCNMENLDPIGLHTGESIVLAPSQTLTDMEYQKLRKISIKIAHSFNIIGECNVQFALSPFSENYRVIEINARLSRSSALASKATGYPLAFIAAKLALGYGLHELKNAVTHHTSSFFEPTLDYVVCKLPLWDFKKFHRVSNEIGSCMKSVGEVMAIGGSFEEAFQKGLRMLIIGLEGFITHTPKTLKRLQKNLNPPTDCRIEAIEEALNEGCSIEQLYNITNIDPWVLYKLRNLHHTKEVLNSYKKKKYFPEEWLYIAKNQGFSDRQIAMQLQYNIEKGSIRMRKIRKIIGILPYTRHIDTMAAEFPAKTKYLYISYHSLYHDVMYKKKYKKSVAILGSGSYRIGNSVEFDWCCVNALQTLNIHDYRSIMINCNPETVSTDFDECDSLYFEELSFEVVVDILELESPMGTILSMGGQAPNNLALRLFNTGKNLLGTSSLSIDGIEDRYKFSKVLDILGIQQPKWKELSTLQSILNFVNEVGYPVLIRPSYVLSGAAMHAVFNIIELENYLKVLDLSKKQTLVVSKFIEFAKEIEIDAVSDKGNILYHAISEHIEYAGIHSGDATLIYPTKNIDLSILKEAKQTAKKIAEYFHISGPFNIQFLYKKNILSVIECNLRSSRSFPLISKISGFNMIRFSTELFLGKVYIHLPKKHLPSFFYFKHVGIKASQFSFSRLHKTDPVLGVDMASTGEVGSIGKNLDEALIKAMIAVGYSIPMKKILISGDFVYIHHYLREVCYLLLNNGYTIYSTENILQYFIQYDFPSNYFIFSFEPNLIKRLDFIINIPKKISKKELNNDYLLRRASVDFNIPLLTNIRLALTFISAFCNDEIFIKDWKSYFLK